MLEGTRYMSEINFISYNSFGLKLKYLRVKNKYKVKVIYIAFFMPFCYYKS